MYSSGQEGAQRGRQAWVQVVGPSLLRSILDGELGVAVYGCDTELKRWRIEDHLEFQASLGCVRLTTQQRKQRKKKQERERREGRGGEGKVYMKRGWEGGGKGGEEEVARNEGREEDTCAREGAGWKQN